MGAVLKGPARTAIDTDVESHEPSITPTMKTLTTFSAVLTIVISFSTTAAPFVAVEFGGRVTASDLGHRRGTRAFGYFIYEPGTSSAQTAHPPNLVLEMTDTTYLERSAYSFYVYNNWLREHPQPVLLDGFALEFSYPGGYAVFSLMSSNTSLFTNALPPATLPPLAQFDAGRSLVLTVDQMQPYRTTAIEIDRLNVVPVVPGQPFIFGLGRRAGGFSFRFLAEASRAYTVQSTPSLPAVNWTTVTNIVPSPEHIVLINDLAPVVANRFYRVRRD